MPQLDDSVKTLPGIGPAKEKAFARLGISTVRDLLFHIPRGYEDRSRIRLIADGRDGEMGCFLLTVGSMPRTARLPSRMTITKFRVFDESGSVEAVFFNQDFVKNIFSVGDVFRFCGKLSAQGRIYQLVSPKYEKYDPLDPPPDICPIYGLTDGISGNLMKKAIAAAMDALAGLKDYLPEAIRKKHEMPTLSTALRTLHEPLNFEEARRASRRLAFDEFFLFSIGVSLAKKRQTERSVLPFAPPNEEKFFSLFPFAPTDAQKRVCREIAKDMTSGNLMNRILVGDVGCGKTFPAAFAVFAAISSGKQAALMVPTEILARQHYADLAPLFSALGYRTALLLGSSTVAQKREIYASLAKKEDDRIDLVIGTHALLNEKLQFSDLGLTIVDEQHRFGVTQRAALRRKCPDAHMLVMSATPIPRTLALVLYGDLDISRIDEMPKGRQRVSTYVVDSGYRARLQAFIRKQAALGGQVYVVCPAIEPSEEVLDEGEIAYSLFKEEAPALRNAAEVTEELRAVCPDLRIGFLHGKMRAEEKDETMRAFADGACDVLVSTTVIEVGINVPNATLMIVEDADRFGLAQLHQLRGRVGRGAKESFCVLVSDAKGEEARARLDTMRTVYDGFRVAEEDLKQRGPGDFIASADASAVRQSGGLSFRFASLCEDSDLLAAAAEDAKAILALTGEEKRRFEQEEAALFEEIKRVFSAQIGQIS